MFQKLTKLGKLSAFALALQLAPGSMLTAGDHRNCDCGHWFFWKNPKGPYGRNQICDTPCGTPFSCPPQGPYYGYYPTCWSRWPQDWQNCPVTDALPGAGLPCNTLPAGAVPGDHFEQPQPSPAPVPVPPVPGPAPSASLLPRSARRAPVPNTAIMDRAAATDMPASLARPNFIQARPAQPADEPSKEATIEDLVSAAEKLKPAESLSTDTATDLRNRAAAPLLSARNPTSSTIDDRGNDEEVVERMEVPDDAPELEPTPATATAQLENPAADHSILEPSQPVQKKRSPLQPEEIKPAVRITPAPREIVNQLPAEDESTETAEPVSAMREDNPLRGQGGVAPLRTAKRLAQPERAAGEASPDSRDVRASAEVKNPLRSIVVHQLSARDAAPNPLRR